MNAPVPSDLTLLVLTDAGQAPEWMRLLPKGLVRSTRGNFLVDDQALQSILDTHRARGIDIVVDYEHQSLPEGRTQDGTAPAAGWIKELAARADGLWGRVDWTPRGTAFVVNKEYRYHSPVPIVDDATRRAISLHSCALTNDPAILGMTPIVNKADNGHTQEDGMTRVKALLGLADGATEDEILAAVTALSVFKADTVTALELKEGTGAEVQATALALKNRVASAPTAEAFAELKARLDKRETDDLVGQAVKDGKLAPAMVESATRLALSDRGAFTAFLATAPKVVPTGTVAGPAPAARGTDGLTDHERTACAAAGVTPENFLKAKGD